MRYSDLAKQEALREWDKARKAAAFEDVLGLFGFAQKGLLSFDEVQRSLRLTQRNYRGLQDIEIDRIRGSVGRYKDFTQTFLPRNETMRDRWTRVSVAGVEQGFPPIDVYQVGDAYFVLDGNHRVSIARQSRERTIQAHVWEFITPVGLSADADIEEVIIKAEYKDFLEKTGFDPMTMEQEIAFTTPGRYLQVEYMIALFQRVIEQIDGEPITYQQAAEAWYDMIYTPAIQIIAERGALERFPGRTPADMFIWIWRRNQESQLHGDTTNLGDTTDSVTRQPLERIKGWLSQVFRRKAGRAASG